MSARIACEERGEGFPFIAIHGFTLDRRMSVGAFEPLFDSSGRVRLPPQAASFRPLGGPSRRTYRRIYPDLPFMGESGDLGPDAGSDDMLETVRTFIEEKIGDAPFLLAGESYGGYLARGLARAMGDRVSGVFFLCPCVIAVFDGRDVPGSGILREEAGWDRGSDPRDVAEYREFAVAASRYAFDRTKAEVLSGVRVARQDSLERLQSRRYAFSFDGWGRARKGAPEDGPFDVLFPRPACFFLGRQDSSVGWRDQLKLAERYPRASFHVMDASGHNAQIEQAGAFGAAFGAWIGDCEAEAEAQ